MVDALNTQPAAGDWIGVNLNRFIRLPLRFIPQKARVPILSGRLRGYRWIVGSAPHGCWLGTYEPDTQRVFSNILRKGDVVFDVGANAGFFTLLASKLVGPSGHVFAFEPLPRNLEMLGQHLRMNRVTNVTVMPLALSSSSGVARFSTDGHPSMGGLSPRGEIEVEVATIDELARSGVIRAPTFIKMDIEGAEHDALRGGVDLLREAHLDLLLSTHGYQQHELCWALLASLGYALDLQRDGTADGNYVVLGTHGRV